MQSLKAQKEQELQDNLQKQAELKPEEFQLQKEVKGINLFENGHVEIIDDEVSRVSSESGKSSYLVNNKNGTCQCKDHEYRGPYGDICKHRIADKYAREAQQERVDIVTFAVLCYPL